MGTINLRKIISTSPNQMKKEKDILLKALCYSHPISIYEKIDGCRCKIKKTSQDNFNYLDNWEFYYRDWKISSEVFQHPSGNLYVPCGPFTQIVHKLFSTAVRESMNLIPMLIDVDVEIVVKKPTLIADYGNKYPVPIIVNNLDDIATYKIASAFKLATPDRIGAIPQISDRPKTREDIQRTIDIFVINLINTYLPKVQEGIIFTFNDHVFKLEQEDNTNWNKRLEIGCARFDITPNEYKDMQHQAELTAYDLKDLAYNEAREVIDDKLYGLAKDLTIEYLSRRESTIRDAV